MINKKTQKFIILFLSLFFFFALISFAIAQEKKLEVDYPTIQGLKPETVTTTITEYVKYIFNFAIAIIGLVALGAVIWAGILYLISAGKPEVLRAAKDKFLFAFVGILLLLGSWLILKTINPQLVIFRLPAITPAPSSPPPTVPPLLAPASSTQYKPDVMGRIREITMAVTSLSAEIKKKAEEIKSQTDRCGCQNMQSLCLCRGGKGASCQPLQCFAGPNTHPCPEIEAIKANQKLIIAFLDEILYYKNRLTAEREDLSLEMSQMQEQIDYYDKKIEAEKKVLNEIQEQNARKLQEKIISAFEEGKKKTEQELAEKKGVDRDLVQLDQLIESLAPPTRRISQLPDQCLSSAIQKCQASCSGGCHDEQGCFPEECSGGNPCPSEDIAAALEEIRNAQEGGYDTPGIGGTGGAIVYPPLPGGYTKPSGPWAASKVLRTFDNCMQQKIGPLHKEEFVDSNIANCSPSCRPGSYCTGCHHSCGSDHYGCGYCNGGCSYAVDYSFTSGDDNPDDQCKIARAARECEIDTRVKIKAIFGMYAAGEKGKGCLRYADGHENHVHISLVQADGQVNQCGCE